MAHESSYSDEQVVQRVRAGERDQFEVLVDRHLRAVYAVAYAVLRDPADAEDVTQETFLKAYRAFGSLKDPRKVRAWLAAIARNTCYKLLSGKKREAQVLRSESAIAPEVSPDMGAAEMRSLLRSQVAQLEMKHREVLLLHYFAGQSTKELSESLAISLSAAKKRLERARTALGKELISEFGAAFDEDFDSETQGNKIKGMIATAVPLIKVPLSQPVGKGLSLVGGLSAGTLVKAGVAAVILGVAGAAIFLRPATKPTMDVPPPTNIQAIADQSGEQADRDSVETIALDSTQNPIGVDEDNTQSGPMVAERPPNGLRNLRASAKASVDEILESSISIVFEQVYLAVLRDFAEKTYDLNTVVDQRAVIPVPLAFLKEPRMNKIASPEPTANESFDIPKATDEALGVYVTDGMLESVDLRDMPLSDILDELLPPLGLDFILKPGYVWVSSPEALKAEIDAVDPEESSGSALEEILADHVTLVFKDIHLQDILDFVIETYEINVQLDYRVIENSEPDEYAALANRLDRFWTGQIYDSLGIVPYVNLRDITIRNAFGALLTSINLALTTEPGYVWVSSTDKIAAAKYDDAKFDAAGPALSRALGSIVTFNFQQTHIADAMALFSRATKIPIEVDETMIAPPAEAPEKTDRSDESNLTKSESKGSVSANHSGPEDKRTFTMTYPQQPPGPHVIERMRFAQERVAILALDALVRSLGLEFDVREDHIWVSIP